MDYNDIDLDREIRFKEMQQEKTLKQIERLEELRKMPFYVRIQQKDNEEQLEEVYETQKHTFNNICKRDGIYKKSWKDEFCLFWTGFLKGEYKSINEYLERKNFT